MNVPAGDGLALQRLSVMLLTGDVDRLPRVPLSLEIRQLTVEVSAVVQRHVGKAQLCRARVDDDHVRRAAVTLIVVTKADCRTVVGARVCRQDTTVEHQRIADLDHRVVRQQIYTTSTSYWRQWTRLGVICTLL